MEGRSRRMETRLAAENSICAARTLDRLLSRRSTAAGLESGLAPQDIAEGTCRGSGFQTPGPGAGAMGSQTRCGNHRQCGSSSRKPGSAAAAGTTCFYASLPESLRRDRSVHFTGALARHELTELYCRATALISYSHFETFAMSVAEALVCGCPVFYTACGGPESYVLPGMGLQVDAENPATLLAAMEEIAAIDRFDREAIARQAQQLFDPQTLLDTYTRWIKEL